MLDKIETIFIYSFDLAELSLEQTVPVYLAPLDFLSRNTSNRYRDAAMYKMALCLYVLTALFDSVDGKGGKIQ